ncbi:HNH endonuclease [Aureimonas psammosilenae]|uniref:HNH endonuclease n=1 Tax=Aureimonas psammosilenae TaxID=2495496 RepID=UPI00186A8F53|nr:HNH endonuclease [Aureimonas psammosilenae]
MPPLDILQECFRLEPATGKLFWRVRPEAHFATERGARIFNGAWAGRPALNARMGNDGPRHGTLTLRGERYRLLAHRVAYALLTGAAPTLEVRHQNGDRSANLLDNLVEAAHRDIAVSAGRKRPGLAGAYKTKNGKWWSCIVVNGRQIWLGTFETYVAAHQAWLAARAEREATLIAAKSPNAFT